MSSTAPSNRQSQEASRTQNATQSAPGSSASPRRPDFCRGSCGSIREGLGGEKLIVGVLSGAVLAFEQALRHELERIMEVAIKMVGNVSCDGDDYLPGESLG